MSDESGKTELPDTLTQRIGVLARLTAIGAQNAAQ